MAGRAKANITDKDITGLKYFEKLLPLFERLREVGCERDAAGNRDLHFDPPWRTVWCYCFSSIRWWTRCGRCSPPRRIGVEVGAEEARCAACVVGIVLGSAAGV